MRSPYARHADRDHAREVITGRGSISPDGPTTKLVITVQDVYRGTKYHDACASELRIYRAK